MDWWHILARLDLRFRAHFPGRPNVYNSADGSPGRSIAHTNGALRRGAKRRPRSPRGAWALMTARWSARPMSLHARRGGEGDAAAGRREAAGGRRRAPAGSRPAGGRVVAVDADAASARRSTTHPQYRRVARPRTAREHAKAGGLRAAARLQDRALRAGRRPAASEWWAPAMGHGAGHGAGHEDGRTAGRKWARSAATRDSVAWPRCGRPAGSRCGR